MITTLNDFQVGFNVHDGEVASAAVLSRPTNRLKTEILEVNTLLGVILNDPSKIPDWIAGTYEVGNIVKYLGKTWKAIAITSATPGSNPLLWEDISSLATLALKISKDSDTGAAFLPSGTTAQRPVTPLNGYIRYNTDLEHTETYRESTGTWGTVGSSQFLGTADTKGIQFMAQTTNEVLVIPAGTNAFSIDSLILENGASIAVPNNSIYKVL